MSRLIGALLLSILFVLVAYALNAQVPTAQPWVCSATPDATVWVPTQQRVYIVAGASCPMRGRWVMEDADAHGGLWLTGGPQ